MNSKPDTMLIATTLTLANVVFTSVGYPILGICFGGFAFMYWIKAIRMK